MKTTKNIKVMGYRLWIIGMMMFTSLCAQAVTYQNSYQGRAIGPHPATISIQTTAPAVSFQSTSAYTTNWSPSEVSTLNADGTVNESAYMAGRSNGPRKDPAANPGTPDEDDDDEEQQPLGDAVPPMMLLACAYLIIRATRRRREIEE